jgi:hypothetical protein
MHPQRCSFASKSNKAKVSQSMPPMQKSRLGHPFFACRHASQRLQDTPATLWHQSSSASPPSQYLLSPAFLVSCDKCDCDKHALSMVWWYPTIPKATTEYVYVGVSVHRYRRFFVSSFAYDRYGTTLINKHTNYEVMSLLISMLCRLSHLFND